MIPREVWMDIKALKKQGYSHRQIAQQTGLHRATVKKYLEEEGLPIYRKVARVSALEPYWGLIDGWLEHQDYRATKIHELLKLEGYSRSYDVVRRHVKKVKAERSIVDAFRLRGEVGYELAREALKEWLRRGGAPARLVELALVLPRAKAPTLAALEALT